MSFISKNFTKIDLFGKFFIFEEKEHHKFSTIGGIVLTMMITITCIVISFLFGKEVYEKKKPSVNNSLERVKNSRVYARDNPVFYYFSDGIGSYQPIATKYIDVGIYQYKFDEKFEITSEFYPGYKRCKATDFSDTYVPYVSEIIQSIGEDSIYCIKYNDDLYFENDAITPNSAFLHFEFNLKEGSFTEEEIKEREEIINNTYISIIFIDSFIDSSDFSNPINYFQYSSSQQITIGLLHRHFIHIENLNFISNQGWIFDNPIGKEIVRIKTIEKETSSSPNSLLWLSFTSPNIRTKIYRNYIKIQDTLASAGGFFNALYIISILLSNNYVQYSFYNYIYNHFSLKLNENNEVYVNKTIDSPTFKKKFTIERVMERLASPNLAPIKDNKNLIKVKNNIKDIDNKDISNYLNKDDKFKFANSNLKYVNQINQIPRNDTNDFKNYSNNNSNDDNNKKEKENYINTSNSHYKLVNNFILEPNSKSNEMNRLNKLSEDAENHYINTNNNKKNKDECSNSKMPKITSTVHPRPHDNKSNIINNKTIEHIKNSLNKIENNQISEYHKYNLSRSYWRYLWDDVLCCKKIYSLQRKAVSHIISFENILEISYKNYLKTYKYDNKQQ